MGFLIQLIIPRMYLAEELVHPVLVPRRGHVQVLNGVLHDIEEDLLWLTNNTPPMTFLTISLVLGAVWTTHCDKDKDHTQNETREVQQKVAQARPEGGGNAKEVRER